MTSVAYVPVIVSYLIWPKCPGSWICVKNLKFSTSTKHFSVTNHSNRLFETIPISGHTIGFSGYIKKILMKMIGVHVHVSSSCGIAFGN